MSVFDNRTQEINSSNDRKKSLLWYFSLNSTMKDERTSYISQPNQRLHVWLQRHWASDIWFLPPAVKQILESLLQMEQPRLGVDLHLSDVTISSSSSHIIIRVDLQLGDVTITISNIIIRQRLKMHSKMFLKHFKT